MMLSYNIVGDTNSVPSYDFVQTENILREWQCQELAPLFHRKLN